MKSIPTITIGVFVLSALLLRCSTDVAGGPGTGAETTNGYVLSSAQTPAANVAVLAIDSRKWLEYSINNKPVIFDSARTDSTGFFEFEKSLPNHYNIQIDNSKEGLFIADAEELFNDTTHITTVTLSPYATFKGSIKDNQSYLVDNIRIAGTSYRAALQTNGSFTFHRIPAGTFSVFADVRISNDTEMVLISVEEIEAGETVTHSDIEIFANTIILEDFNDGNFDETVLGAITGGSWYRFGDFQIGHGKSKIEISVDSLGAYSGSSLRSNAILREGFKYPYVGLGFFLGENNYKTFNLSGMEKLTFRAKGNGTVRVNLETCLTDSACSGYDTFGDTITLDTVWKKYEILPDSLELLIKKEDFLWVQARDRVIRIEFEFMGDFNHLYDSLALHLDDIHIEGMTLDELLQ